MSLANSPAIALPSESALILGATQGIGLGFVKHLLQQPNISRIFATYRTAEAAGELLELQTANPDRLICTVLDITDESKIAALIQTIQINTQCLHWVVNCVGVLHEGTLQPEKSLSQLDPERLMRYFQVNSIGAVLLAKHLVPLLRHGDRSIFATISAKVGSIGDNQLGGWYGYRASKAALNMFMKTAAIEYGRKSPNTIIALLHPGTTNTRLSQPFQKNVPPEKLFSTERTVAQLWTVLNGLEPTHSGQFFSWDGTELPW
ncbi:SDR family NAD(P)-dependent oxidoreductase [Altericista sp. CCNU0014]|uniref:SDR family NAD(P)-dependent oxidoreductase n=1 Tax=Altericista sp. CCNU0014 TaxID=3082949 RepID=UPI00384BCC57